jgi:hypothetical protein
VTETMPMTMPSVVRSARSLLAQIVTRAMRTLSANSKRGRRKGLRATGAEQWGCVPLLQAPSPLSASYQ